MHKLNTNRVHKATGEAPVDASRVEILLKKATILTLRRKRTIA